MADYHGNILLDYPRLFAGNLHLSGTEQRRMVERNIGDDRKFGTDDVGGVKTATQPDLHNSPVTTLTCKPVKSHHSGQFEERRLNVKIHGAVSLDEINDSLLGNHLAVDTDALTEIDQVRRRVQPHPVPGFHHHRCEQRRGRALSVGAPNVD